MVVIDLVCYNGVDVRGIEHRFVADNKCRPLLVYQNKYRNKDLI